MLESAVEALCAFHSVLFMIIGSLESAIKKIFLPNEVALTIKYLSQEPVL